jgi:hypothetical protein
VFDKEEVNIYNAQNTTLKVSKRAILQGWFDKTANLWRIPLIPIVLNNNTDTVLVNKEPTEFLPGCTPVIEAINNVYELKMQPNPKWSNTCMHVLVSPQHHLRFKR